jgi:hypothetical protein
MAASLTLFLQHAGSLTHEEDGISGRQDTGHVQRGVFA